MLLCGHKLICYFNQMVCQPHIFIRVFYSSFLPSWSDYQLMLSITSSIKEFKITNLLRHIHTFLNADKASWSLLVHNRYLLNKKWNFQEILRHSTIYMFIKKVSCHWFQKKFFNSTWNPSHFWLHLAQWQLSLPSIISHKIIMFLRRLGK